MSRQRLFVVRPTLDTGGADRVTLTLLEHLDRERFAPTLVLIRKRGELLPGLPSDVEVKSLDAGGIFSAARPLRRLIQAEAPDIVFSTSSGTNITAALAALPGGPRLVLSERNGLVRDQPRLKRWVLLSAKRRLYHRADCVTAVSQGVADDLVIRLGLPASKTVVVHNPVLTPELGALSEAAVAEPWFDGPEPVLVAAGRLTRAKGFDVLLTALAALKRERRCRLIILGQGPQRAALLDQARRLGIGDDLRLPGFVANPYTYMRRASAFVLSSHFEGLPGVLIQAMACGAPVVATRCPFGPEEIVTDGVDGMLVPVGEADSLARALLDLLSDEASRHRMSAAAVASAQRFTLEKIMPNYVRALDPTA